MRRLAGFFLLALLALGVLFVATTDGEPAVRRDRSISPAAIAQARWLLLTNDPRRLKSGELREVAIPASLLDQGVNVLASRLGPARGALQLAGDVAEIRVSLGLPLGRHANLRLVFGTRDSRPVLESARLGSLPLPATVIVGLTGIALAASAYRDDINLARAALRSVRIDAVRQQLVIGYSWQPALLERARHVAFSPADLARLREAHAAFAALTERHPAGSRVPLPALLGPLLDERDRDGRRAALLVLSVYLAEKNLAALVPQAADWPRPRPLTLTLLDRHDSAQHFAISAALAAWAGEPVADAIGTYKELADARHGSGFSFADLAADRAGTRFGERIASGERQWASRSWRDAELCPPLDDLPEFLGEQAFRQRYGGPGSAAYQALATEIDRRIDTLPLYRQQP